MNVENYLISHNATIRDAFELIDLNKLGFVLVCDEKNKVVGLATDGDIRRFLMKNSDTMSPIKNLMNKNFTHASPDTPREKILKLLDHKIHVVPILNSNGELVDLVTRDHFPLNSERTVIARAKAPVRISFSGGGTDLTHYFLENKGVVINSTISLFSRASLKKNSTKEIRIYSADLGKTVEASHFDDLISKESEMHLIISLIKLIKPEYGFDLYIESEFPVGSGLGGSAVVLAAIIGCFNQFKEDRWDNYEIAEMAFQAERISLKVAGGWQDQYATVFGGFNFMEFDKDHNVVHPLRIHSDTLLELESSLLLCNTNQLHKSDDIHKDQKKQMQSNEKVLELVNKNRDLTYQIKNQLLKGQLNEFGKSLDRAWNLKRHFSELISNKDIDSIYNHAKENGALGGKLLGAGGGGYLLFYCNPTARSNLKKALSEKGYNTVAFNFDNSGLQAWTVRADS